MKSTEELYDRIMLASTAPTRETISEIHNILLAMLERIENLEPAKE